ncbi:MAG: hypothetical protein JJ891_16680 [Rhizobiaceae bacterium]|nr:hypothetical protein [Rhizobiaceae bacterium]
MNNQVPFEQFYEATGRANAAWQHIEDGICDIFSRTLICSISGTMKTFHPNAMRLTYGIFYASTNIRTRLGMVTTLVNELIDDQEINNEWRSINNKTLNLYKRRNLIAHGYVWGNQEGASLVRGSIHQVSHNNYGLNICQVKASEIAFKKLGDRSCDLAIKINKYFSARRKHSTQNGITKTLSKNGRAP